MDHNEPEMKEVFTSISIRFPLALMARLRKMAQEQRRSINSLVVLLIEKALERKERP